MDSEKARRAAYMREYKKKNREKLNKYKAEWNRNDRWLKRQLRLAKPKEEERFNDGKLRCEKCEILLSSEYAKGHDGKVCGVCKQKAGKL